VTSQAYLAFETGGTKLIAAVADENGRFLDKRVLRREHHHTATDSLMRILDAGEALLQDFVARGHRFRAIGFGYGGQVDRTRERAMQCFHEDGWESLDVLAELRKRFGLPARIENDCKLAALAEAQDGAGRGFRTVFYITIGTGIGGGIVRDGRILDLGGNGEAEIGHMTVEFDDALTLPCACGKRGCLEAHCSGPGLRGLARHIATRDEQRWPDDAIARAAAQGALDGPALFQAWRAGNAFADVVIQHATGLLGRGLGAMIQIVNPDVVVLGGGVATGNAGLIERIDRQTRPFIMPNLRDHTRFVPTQLREDVVAHGAALLARQVS
jgi:glucokinase